MDFIVVKQRGKWCVLALKARVFFFIGKGKRFCDKKCKELNSGL